MADQREGTEKEGIDYREKRLYELTQERLYNQLRAIRVNVGLSEMELESSRR